MPAMAPRRKDEHPLEVHPEYIAALAKECERIGVAKVAKTAGMSRTTLWALLANRKPSATAYHRATVAAAERVRTALAKIEPEAEPLPPPTIMVRGPGHTTWALARKLAKTRR